jgi:hypothetical protein
MGKVNFAYGKYTGLSSQPIVEGRVRVTPDTQDLFFDLNGERVHITNCIFVDELPNSLVAEKVYIKSDGTLWALIDGIITQLVSGGSGGGSNIYISSEVPEDSETGDIWFVTSQEGE